MAKAHEEISLDVPNIVCDGCAQRIRSTLTSVTGVQAVKVSVWRRKVGVRYDASEVSKAALVRALEKAKFNVLDA